MNKMIAELDSVKTTFEIEDEVLISELIQTFVNFAMAMTFTEPQIIEAMINYVCDRISDADWYSDVWNEINDRGVYE